LTPPSWQRTTIAGRAADVFEPTRPRPGTLVWLCDDSGKRPPELLDELAARELRCVVPEARGVWWLDRIEPPFDPAVSPEEYLVEHLAPALGARPLAVVGSGRGGQGAVRLALRHPGRFPVAASLDGAFDFHEHFGCGTSLDDLYPSREHARQDTAILQVDAHNWPPYLYFACSPESEWYRGNDRLHEKLSAMGVPHTAELDSPGELAALVAFVAEGLSRESRRLV
jgi:S-formylglutathione hydrolase